jgi:hypothetical protein
MLKATIIATTIITAGIFTNGSPATAGPFDGGGTRTQLAQEFCVGPVCAEDRYRDFRDREDFERREARERAEHRDCRDVEIRDRRPDGDVVIRHVWRCRRGDRGS